MKKEEYIQSFKEHKSLRLHINRTDRRNGLGPTIAKALLSQLEAAFDLAQVGAIHSLLITAESHSQNQYTTWIAGGDLKELAQLTHEDDVTDYIETMKGCCSILSDIPAVVIMAIDGVAIGGGAELALFSDIRIASLRSTIEFRQLSVGLPTGYGGAARLHSLVGLGHAQRLIWLRSPITATEAKSLGLVHEVVDDTESLSTFCKQLMESFASLPHEAIAAQKMMLEKTLPEVDATTLFTGCWRNPLHSKVLSSFE